MRGWSLFDRFMAYVSPEPTSGCWLWTGALMRDEPGMRYGELQVDGKPRRAHRLSWELHRGPIPEGMWVLHKCDNPPCVNPDHLFLGTAKDNAVDRQQKSRQGPCALTAMPGESNPQSKLTAADVAVIRQSAETHAALARRFGVSDVLIGKVRRREIWR